MIRLAGLALALTLAPILAMPAQAAPYRAPRTASGAPDLQGQWTNLSVTRLERPAAFPGLYVPDAEAAAYLARRNDRLNGVTPPAEPGHPPPPNPDEVGAATTEFPDRDVDFLKIDGRRRSSILVQPADGHLPYTAEGAARVAALDAADDHDLSGPEARLPNERCLVSPGGGEGPPIVGEAQNANYLIVQTPHEVAIVSEMIHDVRIVRMGAKHPATPTHPWMGDSIGWWEGDTLVVETVDQNPIGAPRAVGPRLFYVSPSAKVMERFTRVSPTQIRYDFTLEDPAIYTQTLRGEAVFNATRKPMYEYACHEANYALPNILAGARREEREAAAAGR